VTGVPPRATSSLASATMFSSRGPATSTSPDGRERKGKERRRLLETFDEAFDEGWLDQT